MTTNTKNNAGVVLAECLKINGIGTVFGVPGESYLPFIDGMMRQNIHFVVCRNEGGASFMAEAVGKLTGKPGVCVVSRAPGATNASIGIHTAMQDSTPMILLIGQIERGDKDKEAFQEVDLEAFFKPLAKWSATVNSAQRLPEYFARAYQCAVTGRPGPVVLVLPEDILAEAVSAGPIKHIPVNPGVPVFDEKTIKRIRSAEKPILLVGGPGWKDGGLKTLGEWTAAQEIPVAANWRHQDYFENSAKNYAGHMGLGINPELTALVADSDLILSFGGRLDEITTQTFGLVSPEQAEEKLICFSVPDVNLNPMYNCPKIQGDLNLIVRAMADSEDFKASKAVLEKRKLRTEKANLSYRKHSEPDPKDDISGIVATVSKKLSPDAIITNGAGNFAAWLHRYYRYGKPHTQLAPRSGSMGYSIPSAVAAKIMNPDVQVVAFAGDGEILMNGQEVATAAMNGIGFLIMLFNNSQYGTIRMHQNMKYPGESFGTGLKNPDFVKWIESFGGKGFRVKDADGFEKIFGEALESSRKIVTLVEITQNPDASPRVKASDSLYFARGILIEKVLPSPGVLSTVILPECASMIALTR